jgi:hypothetical protein
MSARFSGTRKVQASRESAVRLFSQPGGGSDCSEHFGARSPRLHNAQKNAGRWGRRRKAFKETGKRRAEKR